MTTATHTRPVSVDDVVARVFEAGLATIDAFSIHVGDALGLYRAIAEFGPLTRDELCARTGVHRRYAHEWLEQQVTTGLLTVDDALLPIERRTYDIEPAVAEVLCDRDSTAFLSPFVRLLVAAGIQLPKLLQAYRTGDGVSWEEFGPDMRTGQAEMNRPWFLSELGSSWFPAVPGLERRLSRGARVLDVGCGEGWSSIAIARHYPDATVVGVDVDAPSIQAARAHVASERLEGRVEFLHADAAELDSESPFDVITAFECVHDLPDPVAVLASARRLLAPGGWVIVMDEAVADTFGERSDEVERLMYGFSLFVCLPDSLSHEPSVATGTVIRPSTLERYALEAGFSGVETLPIENDLWRFYRLTVD